MALDHFKNRLMLLESYLDRRPISLGRPIRAIVESTVKCNLFCPMCPRELDEYPARHMDYDLFQKIIDEGKDSFEFVVPIGLGEPLLNPAIFDMISHCKSYGIRTGLSTNGTVLPEGYCHKLIDSGLDYLIFAFDGATKEVYEKYRKGAKFEHVRDNILRFLEIKLERKARIFVILQMIRLPETGPQIEMYRRMWDVPGVDEVRIKEDETRFPGVGFPSNGNGNGISLNPCHYIWQGPLYVRYDGAVFPCCHMWKGQPIGDARTQTLDEIWNSEKMQKLRQAHVDGQLSAYPDCIGCHAAKPRMPLIIGSFVVDSLNVRKLIPLFERLSILYQVPLFQK